MNAAKSAHPDGQAPGEGHDSAQQQAQEAQQAQQEQQEQQAQQARRLAEDAANRQRALGPGSFIVEAPAGAGKTELLAQRFLRLLAEVSAPEEIVALTFTNKAATEMRHRILDNLYAARDGRWPEAPHKQVSYQLAQAALATSQRLGWDLLDHPGRLRVTTIDALCASLTRQMPVLSRFGANPGLSEEAGRHYEAAARRALAWLEESGPAGPIDGSKDATANELVNALAEAVADALRHLDNNAEQMTRLLAAMLARRDQWLRHALDQRSLDQAAQGLRALVTAELRQIAAKLPAGMWPQVLACGRFAAGHLDGIESSQTRQAISTFLEYPNAPKKADTDDLPLWRAAATLLLTDGDTGRKIWDKRLGFPAKISDPQKQALKELVEQLPASAINALAEVRRLPAPDYTSAEWRTVEALASLLRLAAGELWREFHDAGEVDFIEVALRARQALGDESAPTDLALALDYRLRHLLVDEFQDTSPMQVELLARLTAGWSGDSSRSLFLVGDPMQSIYRFRKADVGLFLSVAQQGLGGLPLTTLRLYRNNRSQAAVVDWVNASFAQVFPAQDDIAAGAIRYRPSVATHHNDKSAGVIGHPLVVDPAADADAIEAQAIIAIIDAERAEAPEREIAVLVRARNHLAALVEHLRRHRPDLPFQAVEMARLADRQVVQDLLALTRALLHRADRVSWLAILRAPWCGLTLADLHELAGDDHASTIWALANDPARQERLSADGRARLRHVLSVVNPALREQGRAPLRRWVEGVWLLLGGPACLAAGSANTASANTALASTALASTASASTELADAGAFFDGLEQWARRGRYSLAELDEAVGELFATPDTGAHVHLRFMTLHKAKGLEFDTVILPGLHRKPASDSKPLMRWEEVLIDGREELIVAPSKRRHGADALKITPFDYLGALEARRSSHEAARVLYVGATRAVRRLHWLGVVKPSSKDERKPAAGSQLALLWPAVAKAFQDADLIGATAAEAELTQQRVPGRLWRLAEKPDAERFSGHSMDMPAPPAGEAVNRYVLENGIAAAGSSDENLATRIGTLTHAYLALIASEGWPAWPASRIVACQPAMVVWLMRAGVDEAMAEAAAQRVVAHLKTTVASESGRWLLQVRAESASELALARAEPDGASLHVIDRSFVEDGVRWIIDYKTDAVTDDAALAEHGERYRGQLQRYADLFRGNPEGLGQPIRMGIFYTAIGRLVELTAGAAGN